MTTSAQADAVRPRSLWRAASDPAAWRRAARRARRRDFVALAVALAVIGGVVLAFRHSGLRFQHTGSLPRGIYRDVAGPSARLERGATAVWCLPQATARWARERGYLNRGDCSGHAEPLGKVVLAIAGDTVDLSADGVRLNAAAVRRTALPTRDLHGRPTPHAPFGRYVLASGEVWLWSPYTTRSFDSRVFGPVPVSALVAVVRPVWTF